MLPAKAGTLNACRLCAYSHESCQHARDLFHLLSKSRLLTSDLRLPPFDLRDSAAIICMVFRERELVRIDPGLSHNASNSSGGNLVMFRNNCRASTRGCYFDELNVATGLSGLGKTCRFQFAFTSRNASGFMRL